MKYEKIDMGSYNIHLVNTDHFKTTTVSINFRERIKKENITKRKFLFQTLCSSTYKYNTARLLNIEFENLYSLSLSHSNIKFGNIINSYIDIKFLNEKYSDSTLLENSLNLLFEIIFNPNVEDEKFDSKIFNLIKERMNSSIASLKEKPAQYATLRALTTMDSEDPVSFSLWGYKEDLDLITEKNLYEYYKKILNDNKIDIFVIGDFDSEKVVNIFREKFNINTIKMDRVEPFISYKKCNKAIETIEEMKNLQQSKLSIICKALDMSTFERRYILPIYASILGGDLNSRLFSSVREKESLAYTVNAATKNPNSILIISSGINSDSYEKALKIIKTEIKNMNKITDLEVENAKSEIISSLDSLFDDPMGIINYYFGIEVFEADTIEEKKKNFAKVNKKDVEKFASKVKIASIYLLRGELNEEK